ncbi:trypsin inhibitor like cysteine rich domain-containing protein [Ditylenchus destructor]|uniref:Trypsin inhibitor like cysteine rich domain-containing protein n=1 Tax=Ditylenchus destructor TaxID=166010 RepID=A0AAD4N183_9BILA|nr:trypsin inhibitor like cysteine rich domain-containing protein [Ditylenchus destructor]
MVGSRFWILPLSTFFLLLALQSDAQSSTEQPQQKNLRNPNPPCDINEVFLNCSSICEPKCGKEPPRVCPMICGPPKCQCEAGFWRHKNGFCVPKSDCVLSDPQPSEYPNCTFPEQIYHQCADVRCGVVVPEPICNGDLDFEDSSEENSTECQTTPEPTSTPSEESTSGSTSEGSSGITETVSTSESSVPGSQTAETSTIEGSTTESISSGSESTSGTEMPPLCGGNYGGCRCAPGYKRDRMGQCVEYCPPELSTAPEESSTENSNTTPA